MIYNFNAGPAVLPQPVLARAQAELLDYAGTGISIMEMSHRAKEFEAIVAAAEARLLALVGLSAATHRVLFMQGGASLQFSMVPFNYLPQGASAAYVVTGTWGEKALEEAKKLGDARLAASTAESGYTAVAEAPSIQTPPDAAYMHLTSNETIQGVQYHAWPVSGEVPLVVDMSSDILSRPFAYATPSLIYAGAQKNLGPSGVTVVIVRKAFLDLAQTPPASMLSYAVTAKNSSLYNTPPTFGIYLLDLVLQWVEQLGGLAAIGERNERKAAAIYGAIDATDGFYRGHAAPSSRSQMNVTFRLPYEALEKQFVADALRAGMIGLAGHRSVGGVRASLYNALEPHAADALATFMGDFADRNG